MQPTAEMAKGQKWSDYPPLPKVARPAERRIMNVGNAAEDVSHFPPSGDNYRPYCDSK